MTVTIAREDPAQPEIEALLADGEAHSASLYPTESNHHAPLDALRAANVRFLVARNDRGLAIGTGAIVLNGDWAEIKGLWVVEAARGMGISKHLLDALTTEAKGAGVSVLRLETGIASHAALGLYRNAGFHERDPFAAYAPDPLSVFMEKRV